MPVIERWPPVLPELEKLPQGQVFYRVFDPAWSPFAPNSSSGGRFALTGKRGMLYFADSPVAALWETVLRNVQIRPGTNRVDEIPTVWFAKRQMVGFVCDSDHLPGVLPLSPPGLRRLFDASSPEYGITSSLTTTVSLTRTHEFARELEQWWTTAARVEGPPLPILRWASRQFPNANVYLAYAPPINGEGCWKEIERIDLLSMVGMSRIREALRQAGFTWTPLGSEDLAFDDGEQIE